MFFYYIYFRTHPQGQENIKQILTDDKKNDNIFSFHLGVWCNGSTKVSKTFCEGSNPSTPAKNPNFLGFFYLPYQKKSHTSKVGSFFITWQNQLRVFHELR